MDKLSNYESAYNIILHYVKDGYTFQKAFEEADKKVELKDNERIELLNDFYDMGYR